MEKKKISPFEYVIMQYACPEEAEKHEPYSREEVFKQRQANIQQQFDQIKSKKQK